MIYYYGFWETKILVGDRFAPEPAVRFCWFCGKLLSIDRKFVEADHYAIRHDNLWWCQECLKNLQNT